MKEQIKKVVLATLVAAVSIAAQAESLLWYVKVPNDTDMTAFYDDNGTRAIYFFLATDSQKAFSSMTATTIADVIATYNKGDSFDSSQYVKASLVVNDKYEVQTSMTISSSSSAIQEASFFAFYVDTSANKYMILKDNSGNELVTPTVNDQGRHDWKWDASSATEWIAQGNVPEPTSGLLLVLGVATLALKRRRV